MILESLDDHVQNLVVNIMVQRNGARTYFSIQEELPTSSLWNALILPYGCEANTVASLTKLSIFYNIHCI